MKHARIGAVFLAAALIAGCASPPTQQEIASADYGYEPNQYQAEKDVKQFFGRYLKDPYSAQYQFGDVYKGYFVGSAFEGRKLMAGYLLDASVNAKNSFGGYMGNKQYKFLFRNGVMQGVWEIGKSGMPIKIY